MAPQGGGRVTDPDRDHAPVPGGLTGAEWAGVILSVLWVCGIASLAIWGSQGTGGVQGGILAVIAATVPPAAVWAGLIARRMIHGIHQRAARLEDAIDALHDRYDATRPGPQAPDDSVVLKLEEIATAQRAIEAALSELRDTRAPDTVEPAPASQPAQPAPDDQVTLPLDIPADEAYPDLGRQDFITALNFPQTPDDTAGFGALRRALRDRSAAQVIRASQDILTLMSQDGIYMDDLAPDLASPDVWRRFAQGERGRGITALGGVRDRAALDVTATRMRQDAIFRDAAHHFLRLFDRMFTDVAQTATDADISALAQTRTARAFMLLGRVAGTFD